MHAHVRAAEKLTRLALCVLNFCDCLNMTFRVEIRARTHSAEDTYSQSRECELRVDGILRRKSFLVCSVKRNFTSLNSLTQVFLCQEYTWNICQRKLHTRRDLLLTLKIKQKTRASKKIF